MRSDLAIQSTYMDGRVDVVGRRWHVFKYTEADPFLAFESLLEVYIYPSCSGASVDLHCKVILGFS